MWNGIISTSQFAFIILGNLVWGAVCDRHGSQRALMLAMIGDAVFFGLTAFAPFGLRGPPAAGVVLAAVRAGAGFCTPLVSALIFIFDRAESPAAVVKGLGDYGFAIISAYAVGGLVVGAIYDAVGWGWTNSVSAVITGLVAFYVAMFSAPALVSGPRPKPQGIRTALRTAEFATHACTAFMCGWIMNEQSALAHAPQHPLTANLEMNTKPSIAFGWLLACCHRADALGGLAWPASIPRLCTTYRQPQSTHHRPLPASPICHTLARLSHSLAMPVDASCGPRCAWAVDDSRLLAQSLCS